MSEIRTISIPQFSTHTGAKYDQLNLYYQHFGRGLQDAPVVLVNHSLTENANVAGKNGWWTEIVGPGLAIDTDRFAVIAFNIPGNGTQRQFIKNYRDFHMGDVARLFYEGLRQLEIDSLFAIVGGSIGGGVAWEMASQYPALASHLVPIATDWKATDWVLANTLLQQRILENSSDPLRDARIHAILTYRTPLSLSHRFGRTINDELGKFNVESWLLHHGDKLSKRFCLDSYLMVNHLLASIDITRNGESPWRLIQNIQSDIHLIAVSSDILFVPDETLKTFNMVKPVKDNIFYNEIESIHGHDAFLIENDKIFSILKNIFIPCTSEFSL